MDVVNGLLRVCARGGRFVLSQGSVFHSSYRVEGGSMQRKLSALIVGGIVAACIAVPVYAGKGNGNGNPNPGTPPPNANNTGYPPGRPWEAVAADFQTVFAKLNLIIGNTVTILDRLDKLGTDLGNVADDVATLKNTLAVQVSVVPDATRKGGTSVPVLVTVHVSQNGAGVAGLVASAFGYNNAFGAGGATYCGNSSCFTAGVDGVYRIRLDGNWTAGQYAGALTVSTDTGAAIAQGDSLVTFDIPAP